MGGIAGEKLLDDEDVEIRKALGITLLRRRESWCVWYVMRVGGGLRL